MQQTAPDGERKGKAAKLSSRGHLSIGREGNLRIEEENARKGCAGVEGGAVERKERG